VPLLCAVPLLAAACSSSSASGGASQGAAAPTALCQSIGGVLADGPDADVDPVGAAQSQIRPLSAITSSDHTVTVTLDKLIAADRALVAANGHDAAAATSITKAEDALNTPCPGVAS
jgi:ABC-type phosphate/phosphonate transport system ATPase subunit